MHRVRATYRARGDAHRFTEKQSGFGYVFRERPVHTTAYAGFGEAFPAMTTMS